MILQIIFYANANLVSGGSRISSSGGANLVGEDQLPTWLHFINFCIKMKESGPLVGMPGMALGSASVSVTRAVVSFTWRNRSEHFPGEEVRSVKSWTFWPWTRVELVVFSLKLFFWSFGQRLRWGASPRAPFYQRPWFNVACIIE